MLFTHAAHQNARGIYYARLKQGYVVVDGFRIFAAHNSRYATP